MATYSISRKLKVIKSVPVNGARGNLESENIVAKSVDTEAQDEIVLLVTEPRVLGKIKRGQILNVDITFSEPEPHSAIGG